MDGAGTDVVGEDKVLLSGLDDLPEILGAGPSCTTLGFVLQATHGVSGGFTFDVFQILHHSCEQLV